MAASGGDGTGAVWRRERTRSGDGLFRGEGGGVDVVRSGEAAVDRAGDTRKRRPRRRAGVGEDSGAG